ncbi:MAG: MerR family transcriptional regulator [Magnetospirillum sp.]|nr:MAG: MerR family transcriptional regulator [Magnetospirillum sp.]
MNSEDGELSSVRRNGKSEAAFRTISEVADELDVPQHVLRFWEGKFPQVKPLKRGGGRRYYRPDDVALLRRIRDFLYSEGYTIKGVQKLLKEGGVGATRDSSTPARAATDQEPELVLDIRDPDPPDLPVCAECEEDPMEEIEAAPDCPPPTDAGASLKPGIRRELEGLLAELEQLRGLLQPR